VWVTRIGCEILLHGRGDQLTVAWESAKLNGWTLGRTVAINIASRPPDVAHISRAGTGMWCRVGASCAPIHRATT
jgi:hypothetical protein